MHGAPDRPFRTNGTPSDEGPSIGEQRGEQMPERKRRDQDPRSYAGRQERRHGKEPGVGPGDPGDEERTTMARATAAPVPVMTNTDAATGPNAKGSGTT